MPIYDYRCQSCENEFEAYRAISGDDAEVKCPKCGAQNSERMMPRSFGQSPRGDSCGPSFFSG